MARFSATRGARALRRSRRTHLLLLLPATVDRHLYFVHALPADATSISLPDLHQLLSDYIQRNESERVALATEREGRSWRKTEGKGKREVELEKQKEDEESEYRSGFGAPFCSSFLSGRHRTLTWVPFRVDSPPRPDSPGERRPVPSVGQARAVKRHEEHQGRRPVLPRAVRLSGSLAWCSR